MRSRRSSILVSILGGLASLSVLACSTWQYQSSTTSSAYGLTDAEFDKPIEFHCLAGLEVVRAALACETGGGTMCWSLRDPTGQERWQGSTSGELDVEQSFEPIPGVWTMQLAGVGCTGFYRLAVKGRGGQALNVKLTVI